VHGFSPLSEQELVQLPALKHAQVAVWASGGCVGLRWPCGPQGAVWAYWQ
jgi:hypothetical protein